MTVASVHSFDKVTSMVLLLTTVCETYTGAAAVSCAAAESMLTPLLATVISFSLVSVTRPHAAKSNVVMKINPTIRSRFISFSLRPF